MNVTEATKLYSDNWCKPFTTLEVLFAQIKILAENGCYTMCIGVSSDEAYATVCTLRGLGYQVEDYNGGNEILEITWG